MGVMLGVVLASGARADDPPARRVVVLTSDCGTEIDDQWALAHLALSPAIDLKGVVTTHSPSLKPPAAEAAAGVARAVLDRLPIRDKPPVLAGSSRPLADKAQPLHNPGVDFLLEQARGRDPDNRLIVLVLGAATDVASALLIDPTWADRITIVAMGFDAWPGGGDVWNVKNDVKAWQVLLESRAPIVVGDSAVCRRYLLLVPERARTLVGDRGPAGAYLAGLVADWLDRHPDLAERAAGRRDAWPLWDEVTVAYLLGLTRAATYPRPRLRDDLRFARGTTPATITWITAIDADRLWADLAERLHP
jgi:purine nucleosidase